MSEPKLNPAAIEPEIAKPSSGSPIDPAEANPDPFDPARLRLDQSFVETAGVKKLLTTVPVDKPNDQDYVRTHPSKEYRETVAIIRLRADRETYVVVPEIAQALPGECAFVRLYTCINRQGAIRLWPVTLPGPDGRLFEGHRVMAEAAEGAIARWTRIKWNQSIQSYDVFEASQLIPDPEWPDFPFRELLRVGFRDRLIDRLDHPVLEMLRGLR